MSVTEEVGEVLIRYATGIDRRDWDLFRTCFTDDVEADYGEIGVWHGVDEITTWMRDTHAPCGHTMHRITNVAVTPVGDDHAEARSYVEALVLFGDNVSGVNAVGFYDDELVRTDGSWRIAKRRFTTVRVDPVGA
jgi:3-phenylpropionate/cinnamic acid dioxygenase small subunit